MSRQPKNAKTEPVVEATEPVVEPVAAEPTEPVAAPAQAPQRTSVQRVVYKQIEGRASVGQFLTVIVMEDQTVTLELDVPKEVAADVAAALVALESPLYVIQPV
jgi:hypothetical protein